MIGQRKPKQPKNIPAKNRSLVETRSGGVCESVSNRSSIEWEQPQGVRKHSTRGLTQQIGTSDWRAEMDSTRLCSVEECDRLGISRASDARVCLMHYKRWKRHGDFHVTKRKYSPPNPGKRACAADGCLDLEDGACGYCKMHMTRIRRHGNAQTVIQPNERSVRRGEDAYQWTGDDASYAAVHQRLRKARGPASSHSCVDCGRSAAHWSYVRGAEDERVSDLGPYSPNLSRYEPRCVSCHKVFDLIAIAS